MGTSTGMVRACASRQPDVALIVSDLPPDGAVNTVELLRTVAPDVLVVVWTDQPTGADALAALRAGARGVLARHIGGDALTRSIMRVARPPADVAPACRRTCADERQRRRFRVETN